ncbi:MAG: phosphate acyltransferase PlsX [Dehalococcoidia bacterium]
MLIALDAMGGDHAPAETVRGAVLACRELGIEVALTGPPEILKGELARHAPLPGGLEVVPASQAIGMDEAPAQAVRQKKDASVNVATDLVKRGVAAAAVSAGNTGAVVASALLKLGRVQGIERPAIGAVVPYDDSSVLVLDVGANADCKPSYLVQFAQMGAVYMERVHGMHRPRVGLLNIGEEATKGNDLSLQVHERLRQSSLNFVGNVEANAIHQGVADVVVTDGFTGNVAVKAGEGVADFLFSQLRRAIMSRPQYRLAALVLRPAFQEMRQRMDYSEHGGAPLLGVNGVVIIAHGHADAAAIKSALRIAHEAVATGMLDALRSALKR